MLESYSTIRSPLAPLTEALKDMSDVKERRLKLFVVGESSSYRDDWSEWGGRAIVIAHDEDEAMGMAGEVVAVATEIPLNTPGVVEITPSAPSNL